MVTVQAFLGFSLCALLILHTHGFPSKGSKSHGQSSSHQGGDDFAPQQRLSTGHYAPLYSASRQEGSGQMVPVPAAGYNAGGPGSSLPETKWTVAPNIFEEGLANTQILDSSMLLPQNSAPSGPVLQSGEISNVEKEAELGNYQHESEKFGYPAASMGPGQGLPSYPMPYVDGVFWGSPYLYPLSSPYPYFDYRLLYGLYPPGTYTTFSKSNEKGKDYYQSIHYLKEHVPEIPTSGQQKKIFPQPPKNM
ncbi:uncharacterized protein [Nothobranchius furzeri]|uniref:LOC107382036-like protein n=1 Tax=Nothobranchius furzeri TaxID=105023 RepID=A0A9D3C3X0_NOTFU|nr:putative LOC107382036-like protein [Nothobranchius furzeri]